MEGKKTIKISLETAICIAIIFLLCIGLAFLYLKYNEFKSQIAQFEQETINNDAKIKDLQSKINKILETTKESETSVKSDNDEVITNDEENDKNDVVPIEMYYGDENLYIYLKDGYLYYYKGHNETENDNIIKYTELSNIKKIKAYNFGTSVNPAIYLITSDGKVYYSYATMNGGANEKLEFIRFEPMKDYKIDDILSKEGENIEKFKILLKDGTTKIIENDLGIF